MRSKRPERLRKLNPSFLNWGVLDFGCSSAMFCLTEQPDGGPVAIYKAVTWESLLYQQPFSSENICLHTGCPSMKSFLFCT